MKWFSLALYLMSVICLLIIGATRPLGDDLVRLSFNALFLLGAAIYMNTGKD